MGYRMWTLFSWRRTWRDKNRPDEKREDDGMNRVITGQILLILCCAVYCVWWYRGYRPGVAVSRVSGVNGMLLAVTAILGLAGVVLSLSHEEAPSPWKISPVYIMIGGIAGYFVMLVVTRFVFDRVVTTELYLIIGWTMLETAVISRLNAEEALGEAGFKVMCAVIAAAFIISMVLYVAYYRMEEMKAFYAAMVPLVTEGAAMTILVCLALRK